VARTITVQLHAPTFAKQQAFKELQAAFNPRPTTATQLVRQSLEVAMVAPHPALATDAFDALADMFPAAGIAVIRMVQGSCARAGGPSARPARFSLRPGGLGQTDPDLRRGRWKPPSVPAAPSRCRCWCRWARTTPCGA
jgi:hypothetical protein